MSAKELWGPLILAATEERIRAFSATKNEWDRPEIRFAWETASSYDSATASNGSSELIGTNSLGVGTTRVGEMEGHRLLSTPSCGLSLLHPRQVVKPPTERCDD